MIEIFIEIGGALLLLFGILKFAPIYDRLLDLSIKPLDYYMNDEKKNQPVQYYN